MRCRVAHAVKRYHVARDIAFLLVPLFALLRKGNKVIADTRNNAFFGFGAGGFNLRHDRSAQGFKLCRADLLFALLVCYAHSKFPPIPDTQQAVSASPRWTVTRIFIPYCAAVLILFVKTCATP